MHEIEKNFGGGIWPGNGPNNGLKSKFVGPPRLPSETVVAVVSPG